MVQTVFVDEGEPTRLLAVFFPTSECQTGQQQTVLSHGGQNDGRCWIRQVTRLPGLSSHTKVGLEGLDHGALALYFGSSPMINQEHSFT